MTSIHTTDAVILCGGLGQRLKSTIGEKQKVMAEVGSRPFLDLLIDYLKSQGLQRFILCTGYGAESVERYYKEKPQGPIFEFSREKEPLGTGGALKNTRLRVQSNPFFVFNGDSFCPVPLRAVLDFHKSVKAVASIVVAPSKASQDFGSIALGQANKVTGFFEKQSLGHYINAGIYCFNRDVFDLMPPQNVFSLEYDFFPSLVGRPFYGFLTDKEVLDIGTPERYQHAQEILRDKEKFQ